MSGCSTVPNDGSGPAKAALLSNPPHSYVEKVDVGFRNQVGVIEAPEVTAYLDKVAQRLFKANVNPLPRVQLVSAGTSGYEPSIWVLPGGKIYVDVAILKRLQFENELASGMAVSWDISEGTEFRERLLSEGAKPTAESQSVWAIGEVEYQRAIESAVDRIYKAGYDPRGLVSFFDRTSKKKGDDLDTDMEVRKEKARRTVAFYAPLLNPIVHTEDFHKMKKRLERL